MRKRISPSAASTCLGGIYLPRRGAALATRIVRSGLGLAGFALLAVSSVSAFPVWCTPMLGGEVQHEFYSRNEASGIQFHVGMTIQPVYTYDATVSVSGFGPLSCSSLDTYGLFFYCNPPLPLHYPIPLSEGEHTATYTCFGADGVSGNLLTYTEQVSFTIDNSTPVVTLTGPTPGTVFSPFSTITVRGSVQDITPLTRIEATSSNGPPSASRVSGNSFEFDFCLTASTRNFFSSVSVTAMTISVSATDSVDLSSHTNLTVTIDGVPPIVSVSTPRGTVKTFSAVSGTATDSSGIAEIKIAVRNAVSGKYWNGSGFGIPSTPIFLTASGTSEWSLPLQSSALPAGQNFAIYIAAKDILGNKTDPDVIRATFMVLLGIASIFTSMAPPDGLT